MLIDRYVPEDVCGRVPELAGQTDPILRQLDGLLDDGVLCGRVRADLARRYPQTFCRGRHSTPVEVLLRLLVVKHLSNRSCREAERRVADSLVLRWFCRASFRPVPDATTRLRRARAVQPATLQALNDRAVGLARRARVTAGRKLRIDGTVGQTTIHHPTDSSLLGDGVLVLGRLVRRSKPLRQEQLAGGRDACRTRMRTMRRGLQQLRRLRRRPAAEAAQRRQEVCARLLSAAAATVRQALRVRVALFAPPAAWPGDSLRPSRLAHPGLSSRIHPI